MAATCLHRGQCGSLGRWWFECVSCEGISEHFAGGKSDRAMKMELKNKTQRLNAFPEVTRAGQGINLSTRASAAKGTLL